jgi:transcriptional regulator with XRE-family HTH domain
VSATPARPALARPARVTRPRGDRRRRGLAQQRPARQREEQARRGAVEAARQARKAGCTQRQAAERLGVSPRSLRRWAGRTGAVIPRGRPVRRPGAEVRQRVIEQLAEWGPRAGVPALRAAFPEVQRAELEDLLLRFRAVHRARNDRWVASLLWLRVGAVWATDFGQPPSTMPGGYQRLLCVRDLASGMQLAWRPTKDEAAGTAIAVLVGLFLVHGPPLVLKLDNGPAYRAEAMQKSLAAYGVLVLYSPAHVP